MITITKSLYAIVMLCITILLIQILQICLTKNKGGILEGFDADESSSLLNLSSSKQITKGDLKRIEFSLEKILKKVKDAANCLTSGRTEAPVKKGVRFMEQNIEEEESEEEEEDVSHDYEYEDNGAIVEGFIEGFTQNCAEM